MAGPDNIFMGDNDMGIDLPQAEVNQDALIEEKKMARYTKTAEFKRIREHFEAKTAYYQQFLPGNIAPENITEEERGKYWAVANIIIKEFQEVINMYENAKDAVDASIPA